MSHDAAFDDDVLELSQKWIEVGAPTRGPEFEAMRQACIRRDIALQEDADLAEAERRAEWTYASRAAE